MQYPHRQYLTYLVSKKYSSFEIMAECTDKGLLAPTEEYLEILKGEVGKIPSSWKDELSKSNSMFYRWLRNLSLLPMWKQSPEAMEALYFVRMHAVRKDFEALMLMHKDIGKARDELLLKYSDNQIPSKDTLDLYCQYFWNLGCMSYEDIFHFLEETQEREELLPAIQGDLTGTYSRLGLRQRIEAEQFYDNIIALANQQVEHARRNGHERMNGSTLMGIAALTRQALDALKARDELHIGETITTIDLVKEQAAAFKLRMIKGESIPSFDDLEKGGVIDAEFTEADNVRQFNRG